MGAIPRLLCLALSPLLVACAAGPRQISLPLQQAWYEGQLVDYVSTDTSDAALALKKGLNHVPRLADVLPAEPRRPGQPSALERVYAFVDGSQASVFPSIPRPLGAANADQGYSPLWRMVEARWQAGRPRRLLKSEEALLAAEAAGDISLRPTRIVINCPVLRSPDGGALPGAR